MRREAVLPLAVLLGILLAGCRKAPSIDVDTAMELLRDRNTDPLRMNFSASPPSGDPRVQAAYDRLADAHVIHCTETRVIGRICEPGPAGEGLSVVSSAELSLLAGRWVPASLVRITRSGDDVATAEVRMTFEPSPLYRDFQSVFDQIRESAGASAIDYKREAKVVRAVYQRMDDGWHLEDVN